MLVTKCDLCKRVIKDGEEITAGFGWKLEIMEVKGPQFSEVPSFGH
jgi:hypothetical protein